MRKIFTIFLLVSMMCVSICGCSSASARQEAPLTIEEKTEVDALETAITATDANQTIEEPEEDVVCHTEEVDGFSDDIDYLSIMKQSCLNGDYEAGLAAEKARNKKIDVLDLDVIKVFLSYQRFSRMNVVTSACPLSGSWLLAKWLSIELTPQSSQIQSKKSSTQKGNMLTRIQTISKT